jgi:hypothetical protein
MRRCKTCQDTGWVYEAHPEKAWTGTRSCGCGTAGMPCPKCSPDADWNADPERPPNVAGAGKSIN